jgi:hypothetical protein
MFGGGAGGAATGANARGGAVSAGGGSSVIKRLVTVVEGRLTGEGGSVRDRCRAQRADPSTSNSSSQRKLAATESPRRLKRLRRGTRSVSQKRRRVPSLYRWRAALRFYPELCRNGERARLGRGWTRLCGQRFWPAYNAQFRHHSTPPVFSARARKTAPGAATLRLLFRSSGGGLVTTKHGTHRPSLPAAAWL